jgi:hypothetical protein
MECIPWRHGIHSFDWPIALNDPNGVASDLDFAFAVLVLHPIGIAPNVTGRHTRWQGGRKMIAKNTSKTNTAPIKWHGGKQ